MAGIGRFDGSSVQGVRIDPEFVLWIDLDLDHGLELGLIKGRHRGLRRAEGLEVGFRLLQPPVIGIGRAVAPRGLVRLGRRVDRRLFVAFGLGNVRRQVVGIGLKQTIGSAFSGIPDFVQSGIGVRKIISLAREIRDGDERRKLKVHNVDGSGLREGVVEAFVGCLQFA